MPLLIAGINHKTADLNLREQVAFVVEELPTALREARDIAGLEELAILSTCNRTEIIGYGASLEEQPVITWLSAKRKLPTAILYEHLYRYWDAAALEHLARVACGMDSMVFGEPQIFGQVKESFSIAQEHGCIGAELGRIFPHVFRMAKQVRTETGIGESPLSLASAILALARQLFNDFHEREALLVGTGEMIELAAHRLREQGLQRMVFANRTPAHAAAMADSMGACSVPLTDIPRFLATASIVVSGTGSPQIIIGREMMAGAAPKRRHTILMVDLAVPRDIDPAINDLDDIYLYGIDDLQGLVEDGARRRGAEAQRAAKMLREETENYLQMVRGRNADRLITAYRDHVRALCRTQEEYARKRLREGVPAAEVVQELVRALAGKLMHAPSVGLRKASKEGRRDLLNWAQELLGIPAAEDDEPPEQEQP